MFMKKYLKLFVVFAVIGLMLSTSIVQAENSGSSDVKNSGPGKVRLFNGELKENREAFREKIKTERKAFTDDLKAKRVAFMAEVKAKKDEWRAAKTDAKKRFCEAANNMVTRKFEMAISQLEKFQTRVGEIIAELEADDKNTTLATESLNLSKQKLEEAKTKLADLKELIPEGGCENMTSEIFGNIKLGAREAKDLLKESREALHQTIKEIKSLREEDRSSNL